MRPAVNIPSPKTFLAWFVVVAALVASALAVAGTSRALATGLLIAAFVAFLVLLNGREEDRRREWDETYGRRPWGRA